MKPPIEPLKNEIIAWLEQFPYWLQFVGNQFLEGESISDKLINETYQLFLEDEGLTAHTFERTPINFIKEEAELTEDSKLKLIQLKELQHVNALAGGQSINFSDNLTIIFGANGAGKSGYIRLLNNAFNSRGDKQILENVFYSKIKGE